MIKNSSDLPLSAQALHRVTDNIRSFVYLHPNLQPRHIIHFWCIFAPRASFSFCFDLQLLLCPSLLDGLIYFIQLECDFCSACQRCGQGGAAEIQSSGVYGCAQVLGQQHHQLPPRERLSQPAPALEHGFCSILYDT